MKKLILNIALIGCFAVSPCLFAGTNKTVPQSNEKQSPNKQAAPQVKNPKDQTDIYAVPLDTSEEEENEEEEALQREQKSLQKRKNIPSKPAPNA